MIYMSSWEWIGRCTIFSWYILHAHSMHLWIFMPFQFRFCFDSRTKDSNKNQLSSMVVVFFMYSDILKSIWCHHHNVPPPSDLTLLHFTLGLASWCRSRFTQIWSVPPSNVYPELDDRTRIQLNFLRYNRAYTICKPAIYLNWCFWLILDCLPVHLCRLRLCSLVGFWGW